MKQITGWKKHLLWVVSVCLLTACASDDPEGNEVKHVDIEVWASRATPNLCEYHAEIHNQDLAGMPITLYFETKQVRQDPGTEYDEYTEYELYAGIASVLTGIHPAESLKEGLFTGKLNEKQMFCSHPDFLGVNNIFLDYAGINEYGTSALYKRQIK